ncbi:MAG: CRISPR-associated protein Cas5 [Polyangiaceae bacterium]|nr:CRISPR-associated protein Cas5 [Polyangiaceae bacterium]
MVDEAIARPLTAVRFRWHARFGFFLRAEAPVVGLGYPLPPRTAVLGLIANVLGLAKDELATELAASHVALLGACPRTHWHACNLRKIKQMRFLPATYSAKKPPDLFMSEESNTQSRQEWLIEPNFEVIASLPARWHDAFAARMREARTHFTPCMGLSEMIASVEYTSDETLVPLAQGTYRVRSVVPHDATTYIDVDAILKEKLRVLSIALPREVTVERRFTHATYFIAPDGNGLPVHTNGAWQSSAGPVMFL